MATGTGKTFTALGCYSVLENECKNLITVITAPKVHLCQQWKNEIQKFGINEKVVLASGSINSNWKKELDDNLTNFSIGRINKLIIITTHTTFSNQEFKAIIEGFANEAKMFLIADEVHGVGTENKRVAGLTEIYNYRLGLSATPKRWFDLEGTEKLYEYFGDVVYKFDLEEAIYNVNPLTGRTYLTPYNYHPEFTCLLEEELIEYFNRTKRIISNYKKDASENEQELLNLLLYKRADIIKNAHNKLEIFEEILHKLELKNELKWTIIYCSDQQIDSIMRVLNRRGIVCHRFTMEEGTSPLAKYNGRSERENILKLFSEGTYQVLVAMHCLDEGVDVPPARNAIFLSSSGNPREYIQRIGRVIRRYKDKSAANIYDIIIKPSLVYKEFAQIEKNIFYNQMQRCTEIAQIAINDYDATKAIHDVIKGLEVK